MPYLLTFLSVFVLLGAGLRLRLRSPRVVRPVHRVKTFVADVMAHNAFRSSLRGRRA